jgi:hypothetical protein
MSGLRRMHSDRCWDCGGEVTIDRDALAVAAAAPPDEVGCAFPGCSARFVPYRVGWHRYCSVRCRRRDDARRYRERTASAAPPTPAEAAAIRAEMRAALDRATAEVAAR